MIWEVVVHFVVANLHIEFISKTKARYFFFSILVSKPLRSESRKVKNERYCSALVFFTISLQDIYKWFLNFISILNLILLYS